MKKWACLLAFPYMVARSSDTLIYENGKFQDYYYVDKMSCGDKEQCEDLAAALNEAHERRNCKYCVDIETSKEISIRPSTGTLNGVPFDWRGAL